MKSEEELQGILDNSKKVLAVRLLKSAIDRLVIESKWFTSVGLALLGFYTALLVQLKLSDIEPINFIAILALTILSISLISGFWIKLCSIKDDIADDVFNTIKKILKKEGDVKLDDEPSDKTPDELVKSISESLPTSLIVIQVTTLIVAIVTVCFYLLNFLI